MEINKKEEIGYGIIDRPEPEPELEANSDSELERNSEFGYKYKKYKKYKKCGMRIYDYIYEHRRIIEEIAIHPVSLILWITVSILTVLSMSIIYTIYYFPPNDTIAFLSTLIGFICICLPILLLPVIYNSTIKVYLPTNTHFIPNSRRVIFYIGVFSSLGSHLLGGLVFYFFYIQPLQGESVEGETGDTSHLPLTGFLWLWGFTALLQLGRLQILRFIYIAFIELLFLLIYVVIALSYMGCGCASGAESPSPSPELVPTRTPRMTYRNIRGSVREERERVERKAFSLWAQHTLIISDAAHAHSIVALYLERFTPTTLNNIKVICNICLAEIYPGVNFIRLGCSDRHLFHQNCIYTWLQQNPSCPLCRAKVSLLDPVESPLHSPHLTRSNIL